MTPVLSTSRTTFPEKLETCAIYHTQVSWKAAETLWRRSDKECWITDNWCCGCMSFSGPGSIWKYY